MKENQRFKQQESRYAVNDYGLAVFNDAIVEFEKDDIRHTSRKIEYWETRKSHSSVLLTNNFDLHATEILVTMARQMLMYYVDLYQFCENP